MIVDYTSGLAFVVEDKQNAAQFSADIPAHLALQQQQQLMSSCLEASWWRLLGYTNHLLSKFTWENVC